VTLRSQLSGRKNYARALKGGIKLSIQRKASCSIDRGLKKKVGLFDSDATLGNELRKEKGRNFGGEGEIFQRTED